MINNEIQEIDILVHPDYHILQLDGKIPVVDDRHAELRQQWISRVATLAENSGD